MTAPILASPSHTSGHSTRFGSMIPMRSPWLIPTPASAAANRSTRAVSSENVRISPVSSNTSTARSGQRAAARRSAVTRSSTASAGMSHAASWEGTANPMFRRLSRDAAGSRTTPRRPHPATGTSAQFTAVHASAGGSDGSASMAAAGGGMSPLSCTSRVAARVSTSGAFIRSRSSREW